MVYLTMTPALVAALDVMNRLGLKIEDAHETTGAAYSLIHPSIGNPISHGQIIAISKLLHENNGNISVPYHLDDLLRGSRIYHESTKAKVEQTSSYKALMARLRRDEEARAYERMINPPPLTETFADRYPSTMNAKLFPARTQADIDEDEEFTYADINRQVTLIINILVSIVACSVAIWIAASHWSTPRRLGLSMGGSCMIGVGEVVVYSGYLRRLKEARRRGQKQVEIKEVIKTWVIGGNEYKDNEKDIIAIASKSSNDQNVRRRNKK